MALFTSAVLGKTGEQISSRLYLRTPAWMVPAKMDAWSERLYYAVTSGSHPCLAHAEFHSLLNDAEVKLYLTQTIIFKSNADEETLGRAQRASSTLKQVGRVVYMVPANEDALREALDKGLVPCIVRGNYVNVSFYRFQSFSRNLRKDRAVDIVREYFRDRCGNNVRSGKPRSGLLNIALLVTDGLLLIGYMISWEGKRALLGDNPHNLPYYSPGALNRWLANLLVNLATGGAPIMLWDPFCGTGSLGLPHLARGGVFLCSDILERHVMGARKNFDSVSTIGEGMVMRCDATWPPVREGVFNAVVTDFPYGRSVRGRGGDELQIAHRFLEQVDNVLYRGGRLVFMAPMDWWKSLQRELVGFDVLFSCPMYVHEGLTRVVVVAEKK